MYSIVWLKLYWKIFIQKISYYVFLKLEVVSSKLFSVLHGMEAGKK